MTEKIETDAGYFIDSNIYELYVKRSSHNVGFAEVCKAIDSGGGQVCDVNGVLKELYKAGFVVISR